MPPKLLFLLWWPPTSIATRCKIEISSDTNPCARSSTPRAPRAATRCTIREKDCLLVEQARTIRELGMVNIFSTFFYLFLPFSTFFYFFLQGYEDNLGLPLHTVCEDIEQEWGARVTAEEMKCKETVLTRG
jgi:hypothetical protein